jgi:thiol-disulfide isomerase/thioredoxin
MNKRLFITLTALFATFAAVSSQNFDFWYQGRILDDGTTVAIDAVENDLGELSCETNPHSNPSNGLVIKLDDATSAKATASLRILSNTLEPSLMQWCMGGDCTPMSGTSTKYKTFTANNTEQVQFDATGLQKEGMVEAILTITIGRISKSINILFTNNQKQVWWYYYDKEGNWYIYGSSKAERYYVATYVPYGYIGGNDTTIDGLSFYFLDSDVSDIQYWVSTTLPDFGGQADLEMVQLPMSELKFSQFNEVKFKKSHVIPQGGLYVGYSFTILAKNKYYSDYPVSYRLSNTPYTSGYYISTSSNTSWSNRSGDLMVRILSNGQFKNNAVNVYSDDHIYTLKDSEQTLQLKLQNNGATPVKSVGYVIETDGKQVASGTTKANISEMMAMSTISIPIPTDVEAAIHNRSITITEVNGQINESYNNKTDIKQYNLLEKPQFMPIFEEFTATWCGWCPRGIIAMNKANEQFGNKAAIIAVHNDETMGIEEYMPVIEKFCKGYPTGVANRTEGAGIGTNTVVNSIKNTIDNHTSAAIQADAFWINSEQTEIRVDTKTTFQLNMSGNYAIGYVLTADGLTGSGPGWAQSNFYSGESDTDPDLQYWCQQPSSVSGVVFNHVAVAAWQPLYGVEGSVENVIKAGTPQNYTFIADISGNTIIQDKSKLKMITLLLNADTGEYINAAQTSIKTIDPSSINETQTHPQIVERYSLDGQKINAPKHGINIIRMNNGSVKKVVVK